MNLFRSVQDAQLVSAGAEICRQDEPGDTMFVVVEGTVEISLPDSNQRMNLRAGDRVDIPAGVRHGTIVGANGAKCVEAAVARQ